MAWEIVILNEVSQREKDKYCKTPQLESINSYTSELIYKTEMDSQMEKTKLWLSKES